MIPAGPELDAQVAKVMGLDLMPGTAPRYSTMSIGIGQMLAWLSERGLRCELSQYSTLVTWHGEVWSRSGGKVAENNCDTIPHALANLVVEVANSMEKP